MLVCLCAPVEGQGFRLHDSVGYVDPANSIKGSSSYRTCAVGSSNGVATGAGVPVVAPSCTLGQFNITSWARAYDAAHRAGIPALLRLMGTTSRSGTAPALHGKFHEPWFAFINLKMHMIDALESAAGIPSPVWRPGTQVLDIGAGHGFLDAFLMCKHGVHIKAYDIAHSYQCQEIRASPFAINFFDGTHIPEADRSFDAVTFVSVLHHAGNHTNALLADAARVARSHIIVVEDLAVPGDVLVTKRNFQHDPQGIFRTLKEWHRILRTCVPGFKLQRTGFVKSRHSLRPSLQSLEVHAGHDIASTQVGLKKTVKLFDRLEAAPESPAELLQPVRRTAWQCYFTLQRG